MATAAVLGKSALDEHVSCAERSTFSRLLASNAAYFFFVTCCSSAVNSHTSSVTAGALSDGRGISSRCLQAPGGLSP